MWLSAERPDLTIKQKHSTRTQGFTLIELLIGATILAVGVLGVATMFGTGYSNVGEGSKLTLAVTAARQMLEDVRTIPFNNLTNLNGPGGTGFDTSNVATLPAADPERNIARKWRYALAGGGTGWNFTSTETGKWQSQGVNNLLIGSSGLVVVTSPSPTMRLITITVRIQGWGNTIQLVQLATLISRL